MVLITQINLVMVSNNTTNPLVVALTSIRHQIGSNQSNEPLNCFKLHSQPFCGCNNFCKTQNGSNHWNEPLNGSN